MKQIIHKQNKSTLDFMTLLFYRKEKRGRHIQVSKKTSSREKCCEETG